MPPARSLGARALWLQPKVWYMLKVGWVQFVAIFLIFYAIVRKVRARRRARGRRRRAPAEAGRGAEGPAPLTIRRRPARASVRPSAAG